MNHHSYSPEFFTILANAQAERAEAMARVGDLLVRGVIAGVRGAGAVAAIAVRTVGATLRRQRRQRAMAVALRRLDDRLLRDIGLNRADLDDPRFLRRLAGRPEDSAPAATAAIKPVVDELADRSAKVRPVQAHRGANDNLPRAA